MKRLEWLILALLLASQAAGAVCDARSTPSFQLPPLIHVLEDVPFLFDINTSNMADAEAYALILLDSEVTGLSLGQGGLLNFTPSKDDAGISRVAITAINGSCASTHVMVLNVHTRPDVIPVRPADIFININQSQTVRFEVEVLGNQSISSIRWTIDSKPINGSSGNLSVTYNPGYALVGTHNITATVTDMYNLSGRVTWTIEIGRINRAPVLIHNIPDFTLFKNTLSRAYSLRDYFSDPEGHRLTFTHSQIFPTLTNITYANVSINISADSSVEYNPLLGTSGVAYFTFNATDTFNLTTQSNPVRIDILNIEAFRNLFVNTSDDYCGNLFCGPIENCTVCSYDCGQCQLDRLEGCRPSWECSEWSQCQPLGFQFRNCTDVNICEDNRTKPVDLLQCSYTATCSDGIRNGIETGIDCGGPCDACPTCSDGIQNQGETGVDCGGVCSPCPSCFDQVLNQNETDVDCGGICQKCTGGKACFSSLDCDSLKCTASKCAYATCTDQVRNQGEMGVDCGGPCQNQCGTCSDGLRSVGEDGVDCGGMCKACPTCFDGKQNQDESLIDCGGGCRECAARDFMVTHPILTSLAALLFLLVNGTLYAYFYFLLARPERAKRLYDNNSFFVLMTELNRLSKGYRKLLGKKPILSQDTYRSFRSELGKSSSGNIESLKLHQQIMKIYEGLLNLPDNYDDHIFYERARESGMPIFLRPLVVGFYKKADILQVNTFIPQEKKLELIAEFKFLLSELAQE